MKLLKFLNSALIACAAVGAATHASAAIELSVNSEVGAVGDPVVVTYDYSALDADNANFFQFDLTFDTNALTLTNFSNCGNNAPATHISQCTNPSPGVVRVIISDQSLPFEEISPLSITPFGQVTFTIDQPGVTPIGIIDAIGGDQTGTALTVNTSDGTVEGTITGNSGFASSPAPGSTIALGTGDVGSASSLSPQLITVSEIGDETLDVTALTFTGANASSFSTTTAPFTIADGGSDVIVDVNCTPDARGDLTGTLELTNNSVNNPNPQYSLTCAGTSPNVAAAPLTVNLNGTIGQTNPTGIFDITNADDGFTSNALNAALAESGTAEISITDGLTDTTISVDETDQIQVECDTTSAGTFNETISLTYDDPLGTGGTSQIDVTVNCEIANAFPVYESVPTPGSTLAFGPITNGDTSAPLGVDVGNSGAVGGADLNVTAASITGADAAQFDLTFTSFTVTAGAAPDGTDDITVTCSPDTVDPFTADLVVNTDDPAEPAGGFTYPLTCEGTSNAVFDSDPEPNGTLNLGVVPPGSTTPEGFIDFSNEGTSDELSVACTVTDSEGVFTVDPTTIDFTIQAGDTESVGFQCTPPTPGSFTASLACDITGTVGPISTGYDVVCQGEPLVVPTLDRWGLLLMALFVLGIGGLAGRRMMA